VSVPPWGTPLGWHTCGAARKRAIDKRAAPTDALRLASSCLWSKKGDVVVRDAMEGTGSNKVTDGVIGRWL